MRRILTIDFTTFAHNYLCYINNVKEFEYSPIKDNPNIFFFDLQLYDSLFNDFFFNTILSTKKIHFLYRQEDILSFLDGKEETLLYNIDFYNDLENYYYIINNHNWVRYALDKGLINDYRWIYNSESTLEPFSEYQIDNISNINLEKLGDIDEIFISLSPEYIQSNNESLFYNLIKTCDHLLEEPHEIFEDPDNRPIYKHNKDTSYCYCTFLGSDSYIKAIIALQASLDYNNSKYPLYVLVSDLVSKDGLTLLDKYNISYERVIDSKEELEDQYNNRLIDISSEINKPHINSLLEKYNKVIYINNNCIVCNNIDNMFEDIDSVLYLDKNIYSYNNKDKYWFYLDEEDLLKFIYMFLNFDKLKNN